MYCIVWLDENERFCITSLNIFPPNNAYVERRCNYNNSMNSIHFVQGSDDGFSIEFFFHYLVHVMETNELGWSSRGGGGCLFLNYFIL